MNGWLFYHYPLCGVFVASIFPFHLKYQLNDLKVITHTFFIVYDQPT